MTLTKYRYKVEQIGEGFCLDKLADNVTGVYYLCTEVDAVIADLERQNAKEIEQLAKWAQEAQQEVKELQAEVKLLRDAAQRNIDHACKLNSGLWDLKNKPIRTHLKERISRLFTHQR